MKKLIVIGAGISGLASGVYAQRSGFDTLILEKAANPGGVSTSWKRKGYTFEGGIHWLIGAKEGLPLHDVWTETGALQANNPVVYKDPIYTLMDGDTTLHLYRDFRRTEAELRSFGWRDRWVLGILRFHVWSFRHFHPPILDAFGLKVRCPRPFSLWEFVKMLPAVILTPFLMMTSARHYAARFRNPHIRALLHCVVSPNINALSLIYTLSTFNAGDSGYPLGGSLRMAQNMADSFTGLGGEIRYRTPALEIVREGGRLKGVRTAEGLLEADAVVISMDARTAIDRLFAQPLQDGWARKMRKNLRTTQCMFAAFGVKADLSAYPRCMYVTMDPAVEIAGLRFEALQVNNYAWEKDYAPQGCTTLTLILDGQSYPWWKAAKEDGTYQEKKKAVLTLLEERLSGVIPEIKGNVEVTDLATPMTYIRYCDTHEGGYMTEWLPMRPTVTAPIRYRDGIYFTGQRTSFSGGLPPAAMGAWKTIQALCKDFGMEFVRKG